MSRLKGKELQSSLISLIEPLLMREGYELVELEVAPGRVRLFIDKPGGVTLDDCASVSEAVSAMLDVEDPIEASYELEVSSPGLDRPLRKLQDFQRFVGQRARIKTFGPIEDAGNRKVFDGRLAGVDGESIRIDVDGTVFAVPHERVAKANIVYEFEETPRGKPKR